MKYNPVRGSLVCRRANTRHGSPRLRKWVKREANRAIRRDKSERPVFSGHYWG